MRISIRTLVKELLENENLIVNYDERDDGGFYLSVRINEEALNTSDLSEIKKDKHTVYVPVEKSVEIVCPHCGSKNTKEMYGTATLPNDGKAQILTVHYICNDCMKEFDVEW